MEYFRKFLMFIRSQDNRDDLKPSFRVILSIALLISVVIGILLDRFMPFVVIVNTIRGVVANISGLILFSIIYILLVEKKNKLLSKEKYYVPIRKRLSYRQRVNLSMLIGSFVVVFILVSGNPSPIYTLKATLSITVIILLVSFSRRHRREFIRETFDIPDIKDMEFDVRLRDDYVEPDDEDKD